MPKEPGTRISDRILEMLAEHGDLPWSQAKRILAERGITCNVDYYQKVRKQAGYYAPSNGKRYPVGDEDGVAYEPGIPDGRGTVVETVTHVNGKAAPPTAPPPVAPKRPAAVPAEPAVTDAAAGCDRLGDFVAFACAVERVGGVGKARAWLDYLESMPGRNPP